MPSTVGTEYLVGNENKPNKQTGQLTYGGSVYTQARCLICGRLVDEEEDVIPVLCVEPMNARAYQCVVCEFCVDDFDRRIIGEVMVDTEPDSDIGLVM